MLIHGTLSHHSMCKWSDKCWNYLSKRGYKHLFRFPNLQRISPWGGNYWGVAYRVEIILLFSYWFLTLNYLIVMRQYMCWSLPDVISMGTPLTMPSKKVYHIFAYFKRRYKLEKSFNQSDMNIDISIFESKYWNNSIYEYAN